MNFWPFNRKHQMAAAAEAKSPSTAELTKDVAVDELVDFLTSIPDPDKVLEQAGISRSALRKMEYDDEISTALETRLSAVLKTSWRIEPGEGEVVDFVWEELEPHIETILTTAWAAAPYGYSVMEIIYKHRPDGRIGIDRIEERPFEWFEPLHNGGLRYYSASSGHGELVDTTFKFFTTRRRPTYRNPYGEAILSRLYAAFFLRTSGWRFWAQFLERFGAPLLIGQTKGNTAEMATALARALQSAVAAIDADDKVTAISPQGNGEAFARFDAALSKRVQKVILGQTLTTDVGDSGSYAAAKVHNDVRDDRRAADLRMVTGTVQRIVRALVQLNHQGAEVPTFVMDDGAGLQMDRAERDSKLVSSGVVRLTKEYLLRAYDFEKDDFEIPAPKENTQPGKFSAGPVHFATNGEHPQPFTPAQQAIEDLADEALSQAGSPIQVSAIVRAIKASSGPEDLQERLAEVYEGNDPTEFRAILERALFAADVMGYDHMEKQA